MKRSCLINLLLLVSAALGACSKDPVMEQMNPDSTMQTRAAEVRLPRIIGIVETNDTDPRNVLSYHLGEDENGPCFFSIVEFFASNIHKDANGDPSIYFNPELAPLMADTATYIKPIKDSGVKVVLSVLGDWQGIGVSNMNESQADKFTDILCNIVKVYGLDGISFDDEYANYTSTISGSYSRVIKQLRAKFEAEFPTVHKIIGVDQWGNYSQIDAEAGAMIDYVYHGTMGPNVFITSSSIAGVANGRFSPQTLNLGRQYNTIYLNQIKNRSAQAASGGYGGITLFNIRVASDVDPLPVLQKIAEGAFRSTITYDGKEYPQDWTFISGGKTITFADLPTVTPTPDPDPDPNPEPEPDPTPEPDPDPTPDPIITPIPELPDNKSPKVIAYVDVEQTNPLNMGSYRLATGQNDIPMVDFCMLHAAEIRKDSSGNPVLYLNPDLSTILSNADTYIRPLQNAGIGVFLKILGGNQGIGVANMTENQAEIFANILVHVVGRYGLSGVSFDDQFADYTFTISSSYSTLIKKLRTRLDTYFSEVPRLIAVYQWGNYNQIDAEAGAMIDFADHGTVGPNVFMSSSSIAGVTNDRWAPQAISMDKSYNILYLTQIKNRSAQAAAGVYGGIMMKNVRSADDVDPLPVFEKIAEGAYNGTVTFTGNIIPKNWTSGNSMTITRKDCPSY